MQSINKPSIQSTAIRRLLAAFPHANLEASRLGGRLTEDVHVSCPEPNRGPRSQCELTAELDKSLEQFFSQGTVSDIEDEAQFIDSKDSVDDAWEKIWTEAGEKKSEKACSTESEEAVEISEAELVKLNEKTMKEISRILTDATDRMVNISNRMSSLVNLINKNKAAEKPVEKEAISNLERILQTLTKQQSLIQSSMCCWMLKLQQYGSNSMNILSFARSMKSSCQSLASAMPFSYPNGLNINLDVLAQKDISKLLESLRNDLSSELASLEGNLAKIERESAAL